MYIKDYDKRIAKNAGLTQVQTRAVLKQLEIELRKSVIFGEEIVIENFGKFKLPIRNERTRTSIKTGESYTVPEHYQLTFTVQRELSQRLKKKTVYNGFK